VVQLSTVVGDWVYRDDVIAAMGSLPLAREDSEWLNACVRAANALIAHFRPDLCTPDECHCGYGSCETVMAQYGATQLVIEMYRRRGLTSGESAAGFSEFGPPPSSLSYEAQLFLGLGRHHAPVVS
jgi:hypothetical protein